MDLGLSQSETPTGFEFVLSILFPSTMTVSIIILEKHTITFRVDSNSYSIQNELLNKGERGSYFKLSDLFVVAIFSQSVLGQRESTERIILTCFLPRERKVS